MFEGFNDPKIQAEAMIAGGLAVALVALAAFLGQKCGQAESICRGAQGDCHQCVSIAQRFGL